MSGFVGSDCGCGCPGCCGWGWGCVGGAAGVVTVDGFALVRFGSIIAHGDEAGA